MAETRLGASFRGPRPDDERTALDAKSLERAFLDNLVFLQARLPAVATRNDHYLALAYAVRDRLLHRWIRTLEAWQDAAAEVKVACYLSAEFLVGPHLGNNLLNLGILDAARTAMNDLGLDLEQILDQEEEPGLGNGGLGRLAACYLDSLATLEIPAVGYGIRYEFGIFDQEIRDGWQVERTDTWLRLGNPWEVARPDLAFDVKLGGRTEAWRDERGATRVRWIPGRVVRGTPFDTPILGYRVNTCNTLRLWKAEASQSFDLDAFNVGDYYRAVEEKVKSETITKILYPNDEPEVGKELRLSQQYFFVSCSLQDMLRLHELSGAPVARFADRFAIQLNDTHPALAVPELMRLLVDERGVGWDEAWDITVAALGYTNHTLCGFRKVLPVKFQ
ncbi:MAG: glycogen/starch/alpha-glucan phosphorylase [Acidobacteria bacterium]|nr:glycogen/starch/alpha-glucan phosphorylase [Acidobacteriota bacterium]